MMLRKRDIVSGRFSYLTVFIHDKPASGKTVSVRLGAHKSLLRPKGSPVVVNFVTVSHSTVCHDKVVMPVQGIIIRCLVKVRDNEDREVSEQRSRRLDTKSVAFRLGHLIVVLRREALNIVTVFQVVIVLAGVELCEYLTAA